jgi:hypothetical protein
MVLQVRGRWDIRITLRGERVRGSRISYLASQKTQSDSELENQLCHTFNNLS